MVRNSLDAYVANVSPEDRKRHQSWDEQYASMNRSWTAELLRLKGGQVGDEKDPNQ